MGTITVNVDDDIEGRFREVAGMAYHKKKGYLGKAITEAMKYWIYEKRQKEISERQLKLIERGFNFGGKLYKSRDDLYER